MIEESEVALMRLFQPFAVCETLKAINRQQRFVHYTSAPVAMSIIQRKEIWMRKVSCMNDYMEVRHGINCILSAWHSDAGERLQKLLEDNFHGIVKQITDLFDGWMHDMEFGTYVTCASKHEVSEDKLGRLSMWRAYGGNSGVALVFNGMPFLQADSDINVFATPVAYLDEEDFQSEFEAIVDGIIDSSSEVIALGEQEIIQRVFQMLFFAALASKHPGFREEQEWRVIYAPNIWPSKFVKKSIEVVGDQPQKVYKIPFENSEELNVDWIKLDNVLERVIIGPTENAHAVFEAFTTLLDEAGISDSDSKVVFSDIPLR